MSSFINRARHLPQSPTHTHRGSQVPSVRTPTPTNSGSSRSAASFNPRFPSSFTPSARNTAAATMSAARFFILLLTVAAPACVAAAGAGGACAAEKFSSNRAFAACTDLPRLGASVHWTYDAATSSLSVAFVAVPPSPGGWVAWGLNPTKDGMDGAQALVAAPKDGGAYGVETYSISGYSLGSPGRIAYDTSGLAAELGGDGRVRMFGTLKFQNGTGEVNQVWQVGPVSSGSIAPHAMATDNKAAKGKLNLVTGASTAGSAGGSLLHKKNTHGVLNAVSWGLLLPMGAIFARYLKTFQSADPAWFYLHVSCQVIGYAVGVSGWATGIHLGNLSKGITYSAHRNIGISVFALGTLQLFALFLRPKTDHKYRFYWNVYHHSMGYTIIILGIINIFKGMSILDVAQKWKTAYIIAICVLGAIALVLEAVTWGVVLKRRKSESKTYNGTSNGGLPLSM